MPSSLTEIVEHKRHELSLRMKSRPLSSFEADIQLGSSTFTATWSAGDPPAPKISDSSASSSVNLICELKPKSPSAGILRADVNVDEIISIYSRFAKAISVLTDQKYFGGSIELLAQVSAQSSLPTLCKDFIVDPYQCFEARLAGAQAVLLIVKILSDGELESLYSAIKQLGMVAVVEIQNEQELSRALNLKPEVVLINNRNLDTFVIDLKTTELLSPMIPSGTTIISASGIAAKKDIASLLPFCNSFLIGSALMQSQDIAGFLNELCHPDLATRTGAQQ